MALLRRVLLPCMLACASAAYYVSPGGSDSDTGIEPTRPWATLARASTAITTAGDGDVTLLLE